MAGQEKLAEAKFEGLISAVLNVLRSTLDRLRYEPVNTNSKQSACRGFNRDGS